MPEDLLVPDPSPPVQPLFPTAEPVATAVPVSPAQAQPVYQPGPAQPVYQQPVYQQAAPMQGMPAQPVPQIVYTQVPVQQAPVPVPAPLSHPEGTFEPELYLVSHSSLYYWWPVWVVGFIMAGITAMQGQTFQVDGHPLRVYPGNNMGLMFMLTLFTVIMISNISVRGLASALVIMGFVLMTVVFAYLGWWDDILGWAGALNIYLNEGAYAWFSTLMFLVWGFTTFVFDRFSYWRVTPGQMTHKHVFGASAKSYDTDNMSFEKRRDDVFRHWFLGLGSGDLIISAFNAGQRQEIHVPNVLFIGSKVAAVQKMIAQKPTEEVHPS